MKNRRIFGRKITPKTTSSDRTTQPVQELNSTDGYSATFIKPNRIKQRQCVYISCDVHAVITKFVRALIDSGNDISVGGYIDTVLNEHLQLHKGEINKLYQQRPDDLL